MPPLSAGLITMSSLFRRSIRAPVSTGVRLDFLDGLNLRLHSFFNLVCFYLHSLDVFKLQPHVVSIISIIRTNKFASSELQDPTSLFTSLGKLNYCI